MIAAAMEGARPEDAAIAEACARIAPSWPLDRFIAVNPFWELIGAPLPEVAATLRALSGAELLMPRAFYRHAYESGALRDEHLAAAIAVSGSSESISHVRSLLDDEPPVCTTRERVVDVLDATRNLEREPSWRGFVIQSISQFCAAYFDEGQASVRPVRDGGLFATWRRYAETDRAPALLMGDRTYRARVRELPTTAPALIEAALAGLGIPPSDRTDYLWSLLLDVNGWASWCAYRRWTARLAGTQDGSIVELLAIRLAWEWLLFRQGGASVAQRWSAAIAAWPLITAETAAARPHDWLLQTAMEIAWREPIVRALPAGLSTPRPTRPAVQAVFCIDVRSEVLRRALEATTSHVQTLGFAGFFGLPIDYQASGELAPTPHLPGLLAPSLRAGDQGVEARELDHLATQNALSAGWSAFKTDAVATFTFVDAVGMSYVADLIAASLGLQTAGRRRVVGAKPRLVGLTNGGALSLDARCDLAAGILRGMSLTRSFARVVLLVGHGSTTRNNPHAAGLDCGACCGQTGEVSARAAAALLNDGDVRAGLAQRRIVLPDDTVFVAALHHTLTDEVEIYDLDELPASHASDLATLRSWLAAAGVRARSERSARLGLDASSPTALRSALEQRTRDWSQVRPEWGLANNAAFIVAPREHCQHIDLEGRSFLHEYRHEEDEGYAVLETIMTAPMIVTHWINFQYYASTVDNLRYGSGNKVLHNVVGGHIGVFEGNSGDLRIGLPLQSLHDGTRWVHTPLRASVFIEAPRAAIRAIVEKHATVRNLVANGWLSLFQLDEQEAAVYELRNLEWCPYSVP